MSIIWFIALSINLPWLFVFTLRPIGIPGSIAEVSGFIVSAELLTMLVQGKQVLKCYKKFSTRTESTNPYRVCKFTVNALTAVINYKQRNSRMLITGLQKQT